MRYTENALNVLTLKSFSGIGNAWIRHNCIGTESVAELVDKLSHKLRLTITESDFRKKRDGYEILLRKRLGSQDGLVAWGDPGFPKHRWQVAPGELPAFFYYRGDLHTLDLETEAHVSVIGMTRIDPAIEKRERSLVAALARHGAVIVSGLALGCDAVAHDESLVRGARTLAFLPSPLHGILPRRNRPLADRITDNGGLLLTEYGREAHSFEELRRRYYERDRLQALFCRAIILVASHAPDSRDRWPYLAQLNSGSRLAMAFAKKYGVPRAVMYNELTDRDDPSFDLNRLLKEEGNVMVLSEDKLDSASHLLSGRSLTPKPR